MTITQIDLQSAIFDILIDNPNKPMLNSTIFNLLSDKTYIIDKKIKNIIWTNDVIYLYRKAFDDMPQFNNKIIKNYNSLTFFDNSLQQNSVLFIPMDNSYRPNRLDKLVKKETLYAPQFNISTQSNTQSNIQSNMQSNIPLKKDIKSAILDLLIDKVDKPVTKTSLLLSLSTTDSVLDQKIKNVNWHLDSNYDLFCEAFDEMPSFHENVKKTYSIQNALIFNKKKYNDFQQQIRDIIFSFLVKNINKLVCPSNIINFISDYKLKVNSITKNIILNDENYHDFQEAFDTMPTYNKNIQLIVGKGTKVLIYNLVFLPIECKSLICLAIEYNNTEILEKELIFTNFDEIDNTIDLSKYCNTNSIENVLIKFLVNQHKKIDN
jgi:hypothetical protein